MAHEFAHGLGLPDHDLDYGDPGRTVPGGALVPDGLGHTVGRGIAPTLPPGAEGTGWIGLDNERLNEVEGDANGLEAALQQGGQVIEIPAPHRGSVFTPPRNICCWNNAPAPALLRPPPARRRPAGLAYGRSRRPTATSGPVGGSACADGLYQDAGTSGRRAESRVVWTTDFGRTTTYTQAHQGNMVTPRTL